MHSSNPNEANSLKILLVKKEISDQNKIESIGPDQRALFILRKPSPSLKNWFDPLSNFALDKKIFEADVYSKYIVESKNPFENKSEVELIYPLSNTLLKKHMDQEVCLIIETFQMHANFLKNHVSKVDPDHNKWIDNLLSGDTGERFLFRNSDFLIGLVLLCFE